MPLPRDNFDQAVTQAALDARRAGMLYPEIIEVLRTVEHRLRVTAARYQVREDRTDETAKIKPSVRPMAALIKEAMS